MPTRRAFFVLAGWGGVGLLAACTSQTATPPTPTSALAPKPTTAPAATLVAAAPKPTEAPKSSAPAQAAPAATKPLTKLQIAGSGSHSMGSAPIFIADRIGAFREEGLEIEIITSGGGAVAVTAVGAGSTALGFGGLSEAVQAIDQGAKIRIVANFQNRFGSQVTVSKSYIQAKGIRPDSPLEERVKALAGSRIGITAAGSSTDQLIRFLLKQKGGVDPDKDVTISALRDANALLAALQQGTIDVMVFSPPAGPRATASGIGSVLIDPLRGDVPELADFAFIGMFAHEPATKDPAQAELMVRVVRGIAKAQAYVTGDRERGRSILKEEFSELKGDDFEGSFEPVYPSFAKGPVPSVASIDGNVKFLNMFRDTPLKLTYDQIVSADIARKATGA